jgi:hypothetical protein
MNKIYYWANCRYWYDAERDTYYAALYSEDGKRISVMQKADTKKHILEIVANLTTTF